MDGLGIDGDILLPSLDLIPGSRQRTLLSASTVPDSISLGHGLHWEAAKKLLADFRPMGDTNCPLFARKFAAEEAEEIALLARNFTDPKVMQLAQRQDA